MGSALDRSFGLVPSVLPGAAREGEVADTAIRALAFKWIRILFRCWKDRKPYDEAAYQRALSARRPKPPEAETVELQ